MNTFYLLKKIFPYFLVFEGSRESSIIGIPTITRITVNAICIILYKVSFNYYKRNRLISMIEACPVHCLPRFLQLLVEDRNADCHEYSDNCYDDEKLSEREPPFFDDFSIFILSSAKTNYLLF